MLWKLISAFFGLLMLIVGSVVFAVYFVESKPIAFYVPIIALAVALTGGWLLVSLFKRANSNATFASGSEVTALGKLWFSVPGVLLGALVIWNYLVAVERIPILALVGLVLSALVIWSALTLLVEKAGVVLRRGGSGAAG